MIDTHSHLFEDDFKDDLDDCIKRCNESNVNKIVLVGFDKTTNEKAQALAKKYNIFYPTAGLHPEYVTKNYINDIEELKEFIKNNKVYAIGEAGLDYHWSIEFKEEQKEAFRLQLELAKELDLPIIVHSRDANQDTFDIIKSFNGTVKGVMHCYSGSKEMAKEYMKLGFYISLGGPVTFKNAKEPKEVAKIVDSDKLLIETDCPYLAPTPNRGKRNESSFVKYVLEEIATLRGITKEECEEMTTKNAERLFKI